MPGPQASPSNRRQRLIPIGSVAGPWQYLWSRFPRTRRSTLTGLRPRGAGPEKQRTDDTVPGSPAAPVLRLVGADHFAVICRQHLHIRLLRSSFLVRAERSVPPAFRDRVRHCLLRYPMDTAKVPDATSYAANEVRIGQLPPDFFPQWTGEVSNDPWHRRHKSSRWMMAFSLIQPTTIPTPRPP